MKTLKLSILSGLAFLASVTLRGEISAAASLETYYLDPQPAAVPHLIRRLSHEGYFEKPGQGALAIGFVGALFAQHPERVDAWLTELDGLPPKTNRLLAAALWQAGSPHGPALLRALGQISPLRKEIERLANTPSQRIEDTSVESASSMNLQWGAFLATGEERYVVRILDALGSSERGLDATARLAIAEHAAAHPRVLAICQAQLDRQPEEVRGVLRAAINAAAPKPRS